MTFRESDVRRDPKGQFAEKPARGGAAGMADLGDPREGLGKVTESGSPEWDGGDSYLVQTQLVGNLRRRFLDRIGAADQTCWIAEETTWGGWSESTQENEVSFEAGTSDYRVTFGAANEGLRMGDFQPGGTVFARFQDWLKAGEDPEALVDDWFEEQEDGELRVRSGASINWRLGSGETSVVRDPEREGKWKVIAQGARRSGDAYITGEMPLKSSPDDPKGLVIELADRLLADSISRKSKSGYWETA